MKFSLHQRGNDYRLPYCSPGTAVQKPESLFNKELTKVVYEIHAELPQKVDVASHD
jgi:hypothetical protein